MRGIGVDQLTVIEVADSLEAFGARYLARTFTDVEAQATVGMAAGRRAAYLAGRFAAKEAVFKALRYPRSRPLPWTDIEIVRDDEGWPVVRLHGRAREHATATEVSGVEVSISHSGDTALAVAVAHDRSPTHR
jgi:holo-[acyl-carrier protein] synthase